MKIGNAMRTTTSQRGGGGELGWRSMRSRHRHQNPVTSSAAGTAHRQLRWRCRRLSTFDPEEAEQRGKQGQRRQHGQRDGDRGGDRDAVQEGHPERELPEQRDADGDPGEEHRPAGRVDGVDRGVLERAPCLQGAAVTGDDEQGVVDADPEPDQDAEDGREARDGQHVAEQPRDRVADPDGDQRGDQRQERGEQRAEGQPEHDQGEDDPERVLSELLVLGVFDVLAAELDLQVGPLGGLGGVDHRVDRAAREVLGLGVEVDGRERDLPVPADLAGAVRAVGAGHAGDVREPPYLGEHRFDFGARRRGSDRPVFASTTIWSASPEAVGKSCWRMARARVEGLSGRVYLVA